MLQERTSYNLKVDLVSVGVLTKFDKILLIHSQDKTIVHGIKESRKDRVNPVKSHFSKAGYDNRGFPQMTSMEINIPNAHFILTDMNAKYL